MTKNEQGLGWLAASLQWECSLARLREDALTAEVGLDTDAVELNEPAAPPEAAPAPCPRDVDAPGGLVGPDDRPVRHRVATSA